MKVYGAILFVSFFVYALSEEVGNCPNLPGINDFKEKEFEGEWFEIKRYDNSLISKGCGMPTYTLKNNKDYEIKYISKDEADSANTTDTLTLKRVDASKNNGKYNLYKGETKDDINHEILATDYKTYSIVWGCSLTSENLQQQRLFIYSRSKTLSEDANNQINQKLTELKLNTEKLKTVQQDDTKCGRNTGTSIVLPTLFTFIFVTLLSKQF